jgi:hypothetical protein
VGQKKKRRKEKRAGGSGPQGRKGREERGKGFSFFKTLFKFIFKLSNFNQTRNYAFES